MVIALFTDDHDTDVSWSSDDQDDRPVARKPDQSDPCPGDYDDDFERLSVSSADSHSEDDEGGYHADIRQFLLPQSSVSLLTCKLRGKSFAKMMSVLGIYNFVVYNQDGAITIICVYDIHTIIV